VKGIREGALHSFDEGEPHSVPLGL